MKKEGNFTNLYKKVDATSKTRFHASRRLRMHAKFSTYSVVTISLGLILISLMQAYELGVNINSKYVGLIQVFSSVAVLVYSLLIEKNDFSMLSEKMYSCASKLGELKQQIYPYMDDQNDIPKYDSFANNYHSILKLYETHSINDFRYDYMRAQLEMPENYVMNFWQRKLKQTEVVWGYSLNFTSYIFVIGSLVWVICWLWFGAGVTGS